MCCGRGEVSLKKAFSSSSAPCSALQAGHADAVVGERRRPRRRDVVGEVLQGALAGGGVLRDKAEEREHREPPVLDLLLLQVLVLVGRLAAKAERVKDLVFFVCVLFCLSSCCSVFSACWCGW